VLGDYAAHEVGHLLGGRHTDAGNGHVDLMDGAADYAKVVAGADGVGGTAGDVHMRFHAASPFAAVEGNTGTENSAARIAYGLGKNSAGRSEFSQRVHSFAAARHHADA
jgi:hypothetical protein